MTHNHSSQTDSGQAKPKSNSPILVEKQPLAEQGSSPARSSNSTNEQTRTKLSQPLTYKHNREKLNGNKPEQRVEPSKPSKPSKPSHSQQPKLNLKAKAIAVTFVIAMIPVLAVGTAFHYFASHSFEQMTQEADTKGHRRLVPILLMGTGVTAMFAGALAALWANRAIGSAASATAAARKISEEQSKREQLLIESISEIHQSLQEKDILKAAVKQARRVVGADRVLIYSLEEPSWGKVIAESVVPGWPKALGTTIEDPCFKSRYFEQYQNGRIQAMEDIYAANLTSCYLNELESLSVKAGLVVPVLNQGKLLGLLIAHQCSAPRAWEKSVIDVFAQIATQTGLALNNAQLLTNYAHLQKQAENETEWTKLLTNAVSNIRTSLKHEDILTAAVEEARRAIGTDRVVIYSLDEQLGGKVIAESVTGEWPKTLGATIDDPCFSTRYLKEYQNGRVKAIDDIYAANLTPCYLGQLEPFAVKASLIVPILNQGSLLGLLIAHHCSGPRAWEKSEIDLFAQIATQTGLALNNGELLTEYNRLQEQAETETQWKKLFTDASERIHASLKREDILKTAVEESRQAIGVDRVVIYSLEEESWGKVIAESVVSDWPQALGIRLDDPCFRAHYFEQYQNGRVQAVEDIYAANFTACYLNQLQPLAVKASLNVPILSHGKLLGLLIAHQCSGPRAWEKSEMDLFVQIATQTGLALNNAQLLANAIHLQEQAEAKTQWTKLFTDAVANIRTSLKQQDILTAAVEEARRAIVSDRVLIYSLEEPSWGKVIAESVAPGLPKALGTTIDDPCFKARYFEQYQNGRIQAIENIYAAHLTPCYMGQLETLSVTAGLIVPILNQGKLLGLLIAHQCSGPRVWQEFEIKCFAQIAIHVGFAIKDAQLWQCFTQVSESQQETEALQQQVFTLVKDSETVLETFSNDIKVIRETVADTVNKVRHFSQSSHKISQAVSQISDLTTEMNDKAINITIEAGKTEDVVQGPVVSLAEMVRSLTNQLAQTTGEVQPLIAEIETEANQIVNAIEARKKNVFNESELVEEARQKLNQIATVSAQIGAVVQCAKED